MRRRHREDSLLLRLSVRGRDVLPLLRWQHLQPSLTLVRAELLWRRQRWCGGGTRDRGDGFVGHAEHRRQRFGGEREDLDQLILWQLEHCGQQLHRRGELEQLN